MGLRLRILSFIEKNRAKLGSIFLFNKKAVLEYSQLPYKASKFLIFSILYYFYFCTYVILIHNPLKR